MEAKTCTKISYLAICLLLVVQIFLPAIAVAQTVDGNNSESNNSITQNTSETQTTNQTNTADVNTSVNVSLNTGGNTIDSSTGNSNISTGDTNFAASIDTQVNSSTVETGCCPTTTPEPAQIKDNNSDSTNTISTTSESDMDVVINQDANVTNKVTASLSTGNNSISNSTGSSSISTGDVKVRGEINNGPINVADVSLNDPAIAYSSIISNNNSNSENMIYSQFSRSSSFSIDNNAAISNLLSFYLGTGGNSITNNKGNVSILTGDIYFAFKIKNGPINVSRVVYGCSSCDNPTPTPTTAPTSTLTPTPTPTTPGGTGGPPATNNNDGDGDGNGGGSSVGTRVAAMVLGATGGFMENLFYVLFTIGCTLFGIGIRKRGNLNFAFDGKSVFRKSTGRISSVFNKEIEITVVI